MATPSLNLEQPQQQESQEPTRDAPVTASDDFGGLTKEEVCQRSFKDMNPEFVLVLAGRSCEFERYKDSHHLENLIYGCSSEAIRGWRYARIEVIGTFWNRKDAADLYEIAQACALNGTP